MSGKKLLLTFMVVTLLGGSFISRSLWAVDSNRLMSPLGKSSSEPIKELKDVGIDHKIGSTIDLDAEFRDEDGRVVKIAQYLSSGRPIILSPVYFGCRSLCNYHLNGLTEGLKGLDWSAGEKFQVLAISFDDHEGPELAKDKKASYMKLYDRPNAEQGWHFLTGNAKSIKGLTSSVGFKYHWNEELKEWAHPSAAIIVSPEGKITRYLPGVYFQPQDIRLSLNESVEGKLGTFVDRMVLYCFRYDEHQSKYSPMVLNIMKLGGAGIILFLIAWIVPFWLRMRRKIA